MKTLILFIQNSILSMIIGIILGVNIKVFVDEKRKNDKTKTAEPKRTENRKKKNEIGFAITPEEEELA